MTHTIMIYLDKIIEKLEKNRFNVLTLFIYISILSFLRMWSEAIILDYPYKELTYNYFFNHIHIIGFYFSVFLAGILILKFVTKEKLFKITNLVAMGFLFILLPPILEILFIQRQDVFRYVNPQRIAYLFNVFLSDISNSSIGFFDAFGAFFSKIITEVVGISLLIELVSILVLTSIYVYIKTRKLKLTIVNFFCFLGLMAYVGTPNINPLISTWSQAGNLLQPILILRYIVLCIIFIILIMKISKKKMTSSFLKSLRPFSHIHALLMVTIGILIASEIEIDWFNLLSLTYVGNIGTIGICFFSVIFLWSYILMINHVYDLNIDKISNKQRIIPAHFISIKQAKQIAYIFLFIGLGLAISLNIAIFILAFIGIFFGTIYSIPSIRLRNSIFSTSLVGIGSALAYLIGFHVPSYMQISKPNVFPPEFAQSTAELTYEAGIIGFIIFILLSISPLITDLKDIEGDKKAGVKSLFTVYGKKKGVKIISILLSLGFISPLLLFHQYYDFIFFLILGLVMGLIYYFFHDKKIIFLPYFPLLLYCLIRWFNFF